MLNSAPPWRAADAAAWLAARRGSRILAWLLTITWVAMVAVFIALQPEIECSDATPCTADWHGMVVAILTLANLVWLHRAPMLAAAVTPVVVLLELLADIPLRPDSLWATPAYLLVSAITFLYVLGAARGRVAQRALAAAATGGYSGVWPAPPPTRSVFNRWLLGTAACLVGAVGVVGYTVVRVHDFDDHVRNAVEVRAEVVDHLDDDFVLRVRVRGGEDVELETWDAAFYPIGSDVTVLVDGDWHSLSDEPYDPTYPGALALILLFAALTLGGVEWRLRRLDQVLRRPHPVLSVLVGVDDHGRASAWPVDAADADRPLFILPVYPWIDPEEADDLDGADPFDGFDDDEEPDLEEVVALLRRRDPGVVHGLPHDGGAVALEVHPPGEEPILLLPAQPIRSPRGNADPGASVVGLDEGRRRAMVALVPAHEPRMYATGRGMRITAVALAVATFVAAWFMLSDAEAGWFGLVLVTVAGLFGLTETVVTAFRLVVADADGVHVRAVTGLKTRSWEELRIVDLDRDWPVLVTRDVGRTLVVLGLPGRHRPRYFGIRHPADRMVSELNAMLQEATLRPLTRWSAQGRLMPGPSLVMLALAYVGWVVYVWSRSRGWLG